MVSCTAQPTCAIDGNESATKTTQKAKHPTSKCARKLSKALKDQPKLVNSDTMRREELTAFQLEKISQLRESLGQELISKTPIFDDDFSLLRWLIAYDYKIDEVVPKFRKASQILQAKNLTNFIIEDVDEINQYLSKLTSAAEYFPGGVMGYDKEGNVIGMQALGVSAPKTLWLCGRVSDLYRLTIHETALIYQLVRLQEKKLKKKLGLRVIIDMEGFNSDHINTAGIKTYGNVIRYLQYIFPDLARKIYVINAPSMVMAAYKLIKTVLSEESRRKVVFLGSDYKEVMVQDMGAENVYERWGGKMKPKHGDPTTGLLRMKGIAPSSLWYSAEKNPAHKMDKDLKTIIVPARNRKEIELEVPEELAHNCHINWFFFANGDVEFAVVGPDGCEIWPQFRLSTQFVPEYGSVKCRQSGKHYIVFDNSFSTFFSRDVKFHAQISTQVPN